MTDPEGVEALEGWTVYERALYGDHPELNAAEASDFEPPNGAFFVVLVDGATVAGGGFRRISPGHLRGQADVDRSSAAKKGSRLRHPRRHRGRSTEAGVLSTVS